MAAKFQSRFKKVKDAFVKLDLDCTGQLSQDEFRFMRETVGLAWLGSAGSATETAIAPRTC